MQHKVCNINHVILTSRQSLRSFECMANVCGFLRCSVLKTQLQSLRVVLPQSHTVYIFRQPKLKALRSNALMSLWGDRGDCCILSPFQSLLCSDKVVLFSVFPVCFPPVSPNTKPIKQPPDIYHSKSLIPMQCIATHLSESQCMVSSEIYITAHGYFFHHLNSPFIH